MFPIENKKWESLRGLGRQKYVLHELGNTLNVQIGLLFIMWVSKSVQSRLLTILIVVDALLLLLTYFKSMRDWNRYNADFLTPKQFDSELSA